MARSKTENFMQDEGNISQDVYPDEFEDVPSYMPPMGFGQQDPGLTRWQLDPAETLDYFEHAFLGNRIKDGSRWKKRIIKVIDPAQQEKLNAGIRIPRSDIKYVDAEIPPKCNQFGINGLCGLLASVINQNTPLGDLDNKEVNERIGETCFYIAENLFLHYDEYGIEVKDLDDIYIFMQNIIIAAYSRSRQGRTLKFLRGVYSERQTEQPEKKPKWGVPNL